MRESHKRASIREFSRREMSSFVSHESRSDPNISGVSPPRDGSRDEIDLSSEEEEKESGKKRRDSFTNRLNPGDRGRPLWSRFTEASTVQSIAEETSEELKKEIDPASMLASDAGRQRKSSSSKRGSNSYMMTQAGMVDPSVYAQGQNVSSGEQSLSSNDSSHSIHQQPIPTFDSPQAMEQQMKVMEMTRKLMEDHERMMQATAAIMMEHKRLKEELELSKDIERSSESSAIEKSAELTVPSSTEEEPSILSPISSGKTEIQQKDSDSTKVTESASESSAASPQLAKEDS